MMEVRCAEDKDIKAVKRIADNNRRALGFILRSILIKQMHNCELLVYEHGNKIVGFVSFHHRRDGWTTIYDLCADEQYRRQGVGRALVKAVEEQALRVGQVGLRLKCPVDLPANGFYARLGFTRIGIESGKNRSLVIWEKAFSTVFQKKSLSTFSFFVTLTYNAKGIRDIVQLWDERGDNRDPFKHVVFTPLFSSKATVTLIRELKEMRSSVVMFDSGGYQVQMGRIGYEELFYKLFKFYNENNWADFYVLPDHVPRSTDTNREIEFKIQETIDFARLFLKMMPEGFAEKAIGVVHGHNEEQILRCIKAYAEMGIGYIGFGSFGTSGPNGAINLVSQKSLNLLRLAQTVANEQGLRLHVFGIGSPNHLVRFAKASIIPTSFDSAGWWKAGGFGNIFFPSGQQLHITAMPNHNSTLLGVEQQKRRSGHECIFCSQLKLLRRSRMMRIMHNLTVMLDTIEQIRKGKT